MKYISKSDETLTVEVLHSARLKPSGAEVVVYYNENNGKVWVQDVAEFKREYEACEDE